MRVCALEGTRGGDKSHFLGGEVHRSVEKGNLEGERAKRIAFPSETYTS